MSESEHHVRVWASGFDEGRKSKAERAYWQGFGDCLFAVVIVFGLALLRYWGFA